MTYDTCPYLVYDVSHDVITKGTDKYLTSKKKDLEKRIKKMWLRFFQGSSPWALGNIMLDITIAQKPYLLIQWFLLMTISMTLTTYLNVSFFSTITIDTAQGLKYLFLLILFENITSHCLLKQNLAKQTFVLDFVGHFQTKLNQRILSANWIKIKLSDQVEVRRKIEEASSQASKLGRF